MNQAEHTAAVETLTDVLDSGGDERRSRDVERLKAVAAGTAAGILAYVVVGQGPWAPHPPTSGPPVPASAPVSAPAWAGPTPYAADPVPARCPVRVRAIAGGHVVCFGSADAATTWLTEQRSAHRRAAWGGRT